MSAEKSGTSAVEGAEGAAPVRVLTLKDSEHNDATLHRLNKGCVLRFRPAPSLFGRKVFLYTNYVVTDEESGAESAKFVRSQYYNLEWFREAGAGGAREAAGAGALIDGPDWRAEVTLARAGSFHYYFVYDTAQGPRGSQGSGCFQVAPSLSAGGVPIPLDALCCQTVLAKCLGPLPRWENTLRVAREAGYNMIHFTPIQELGRWGWSYNVLNQLRLDPRYSAPGGQASFADVEALLTKMRNEWKMLSICDVVLSHTADESAWLDAHPECAYSARAFPHLRPAALFDAAFAKLTADIVAGRSKLPRNITEEKQLGAICEELQHVAWSVRLHECYQCDVDSIVAQFAELARNKAPAPVASEAVLRLRAGPERRRLSATVDMDLALRLFNLQRAHTADEEARLSACCASLRARLAQLNGYGEHGMRDDLSTAIRNCLWEIRNFRLDPDGPQINEVSEKYPLVSRYFSYPASLDLGRATVEELEACVWGAGGEQVRARDGFLWVDDYSEDFAWLEEHGIPYLQRELVSWGNSVKLRYGAKLEDNPFLWQHMREYVERTAELFDGLRLDNCLSTPLHVVEYLVDCARNVKPDLYVVAAPFSDPDYDYDYMDYYYANRLGITSIIRGALSTRDCHRLALQCGARAVLDSLRRPAPGELEGGPAPGELEGGPAATDALHALLVDHVLDKPSPIETRSVFAVLPSAALASMARCASGSTRGTDDLTPHRIDVVDENRLYTEWGGTGVAEQGRLGARSGLLPARRLLNKLHADLARDGYDEVYVDQMDADVVAVTRHNPVSRQSVILVAVTSLPPPAGEHAWRAPPPLRFEGDLHEILLEATLLHTDYRSGGDGCRSPGTFSRDPRYITGLTQYECAVEAGVPLERSRVFAGLARRGGLTELTFRPVPPGAVAAVRVHRHRPRPAPAAALD